MTRGEVIDKIISTIEQYEGKAEDYENCELRAANRGRLGWSNFHRAGS